MTTKKEAEGKSALIQAYQDYAGGMGTYTFFKIHNRATSDDVVQDAFLRTWKYLVKGGKIVTMKAFLYHVLNGLIVDEYRKQKTTSLDALMEKGFEPGIDYTERTFRLFDGKMALLLIQHLPEKYQKVLRMRYIQNLSLEEISLITKQTRNTTAVQLHRGIRKLRKLCKDN